MSDRGPSTGMARAAWWCERRSPHRGREAAALVAVLGLVGFAAPVGAQTRTPTTQARPQDTAPRAPAASPAVPVPTEPDACYYTADHYSSFSRIEK